MKPNPVKKMVEYCNIGGGYHCLHAFYNAEKESVLCNKHCRTLRGHVDVDIERPSWCTDETFVRVKIEPVISNDKEYCYHGRKKCKTLQQEGKRSDTFYCPIIRQRWTGDEELSCLRFEACRKLEVE